MRSKRFRAGVERLERREVLSTLGTFAGHGIGALVSRLPIPNGSYETVSTLKGSSRSVGAFTGRVVTDFDVDQYHVIGGRAVFTDSVGDTLTATVSGAYQKPKHGLTHVSGTLTLTVVSGTGALANATGHGRLFISQNVENEKLKFTVTGGGGF